MTQQFTGGNEPEPQEAAAPEALPQQEEFYRAPARFGAVPVERSPSVRRCFNIMKVQDYDA